MYEKTIVMIQRYMNNCLFEPRANWPTDEFRKRSYSRWATDEILSRLSAEAYRLPPHISGHDQRDSTDIIVEFVNEMDGYSEICDGMRHQNMFIIARETALDILLLLSKGDTLNE